MPGLHTLAVFIVVGFFSITAVVFLAAAAVSLGEAERGAAVKLLAAAALFGVLAWLGSELPGTAIMALAALLALSFAAVMFVLFIKKPVRPVAEEPDPPRKVDERDIVFSRMNLVPGTPDWDEYYGRHPERAERDAVFRGLPGLLSANGTEYHPFLFPAADAYFAVVERMRGFPLPPVLKREADVAGGELKRFLKDWLKAQGAHSVGVAELKDYHLYTIRGRGKDCGRPVVRRHRAALALTVEMDHKNVRTAPGAPSVFESSRRYLDCAVLALQAAAFLQRLGYDSRAHIDGDYEVICPLVARDAGLGEIGRMGLLMTPVLGPRVRIAVVTTDAPLPIDGRQPDPAMIEFCRVCKKCVDCCPARAIPDGERSRIDGVERWVIDADACFRYWCVTGTDCGRCLAVCPYGHPDNILHNAVRRLVRRSFFAARLAARADDILYGKRPKPKPWPAWMKE